MCRPNGDKYFPIDILPENNMSSTYDVLTRLTIIIGFIRLVSVSLVPAHNYALCLLVYFIILCRNLFRFLTAYVTISEAGFHMH